MNIFEKAKCLDGNIKDQLGPLSFLVGTWEGDQGIDISPSENGPVETHYRECCQFDPIGPVVNGPQILYGLKYTMTAWPLGEESPFHEEIGYWMWDKKYEQLMRCFMVPRVVTVNAGGRAETRDLSFKLSATLGDNVYGILSNPFLDGAFKTVQYDVELNILNENEFQYEEDTQLKILNQKDLFHHTDANKLKKVG